LTFPPAKKRRIVAGRGALGAAWLCTLPQLAMAEKPVAEPPGYWMGAAHGPVTRTLSGGHVIHTRALVQLLKSAPVLIVDVSDAPQRPALLAAGAVWLPVPHAVIPGALWIPGAGMGAIAAPVEAMFRERLAQGTGNVLERPLVIYCHRNCWLSWNAAKRALSYGYRQVYWFPDGMEGWRAAGLPTTTAEPLRP
jgi:PQQ-dependent catabolism-associated CXXCW motif protein